MDQEETSPAGEERKGLRRRLLIFVLTVIAAIAAYLLLGDMLSLAALASREAELREWQREHPVLAYAAAFAVYVVVVAFSVPIASPLTLAYAWFFGFLPAVIVVSFASTTGATLAFLLSRYLFRSAVQRHLGRRLQSFKRALDREGPYFLFTLRVVPAVPFFVINTAMGVTSMSVFTFYWISQLGMLPSTLLIAYAGSIVPSLGVLAEEGVGAVFTRQQFTQLIIALVLLAIFPFAARWGVRAFRSRVSRAAGLFF